MDYFFLVIEESLADRFVGDNGNDHSFFERLRRHMPELTKAEYVKTHKSRLEYIARLTERRALAE
jgi:hypothetical protein